METFHRQGDVLLKKIEKKPKNLKKLKTTTVAYGEVTSHHHSLYKLDAETKIQLFKNVENIIAEVIEGRAIIKHNEHTAQILDPGIYEIKIERELDPFAEQIRQVQD